MAAAALAIGLGIYIPREVERRFLAAQVDADRREVQTLTGTSRLVDPANPDIEALHQLTEDAIARGDYLRVKIWAPDGTIIYSDESALIGRTFPIEDDLAAAFSTGAQQTEISDLTVSENVLERDLADRLIETYVPVERDGAVIAVWETYHSLDRLDEAVRSVKTVVWASVGSGLSLLALFLVAAFGNLVAELQRGRKEAESRTEDLGAILAIARAMANTTDGVAAAAAAVEIVYGTGRYEAVGLYRNNEGDRSSLIALAGTGRWLDEDQLENRRDEAIAEAGTIGLRAVMSLGSDPRPELLRGAVEETHLGIDRANLLRDLEASEGRLRVVMEKLLSAQEEERMRIVGEVHDGLGQDLHRVLFGIRGCINATAEERIAELGRLGEIIEEASRRLRRLLRDLHPTMIEDVGLAASLRSLVGQLSDEDPRRRIDMEAADFDEPPLDLRLAVFRVAQEALRNALKHAPEAGVSLSLTQSDGALALEVADNGPGFSPQNEQNGLGLWLMEERVGTVGGTLQITSSGTGTTVKATFPREIP